MGDTNTFTSAEEESTGSEETDSLARGVVE